MSATLLAWMCTRSLQYTYMPAFCQVGLQGQAGIDVTPSVLNSLSDMQAAAGALEDLRRSAPPEAHAATPEQSRPAVGAH